MQLVADVGRLGHGRDHVVGEVLRVRAGEPYAFQPVDLPRRAEELSEREPITELDTVRVDVLAEQGDFEDAGFDERPDLGQYVARPPVLLGATQARDDAERAGVVAADRDRDPAGVGRLAMGGQGRREDLERFEDLHLGRFVVAGPFEQNRKGTDVVRTENDVNPGRTLDDLAAVLLRQAAADRDLHAGVARLHRSEVAEIAVEAIVRILPYGTCVEHDHVRRLVGAGRHVTGRVQQARDPLRIVRIHLAAVRDHAVASRHPRIPSRSHLRLPGARGRSHRSRWPLPFAPTRSPAAPDFAFS